MTELRVQLKPILLCAALLASCREPVANLPSQQGRTHESLDAVLWTQTSAEYDVSAEQAYRLARMQLSEALKPENARWTAAIEQTGPFSDLPPAVILDIDEAVLDNSPFEARLIRKGRVFELDAWNAWVGEENATAIPGALGFAKEVEERGVRIFYVSNRTHDVEDSTRRNLRKLGFQVDPDGANILSKGERAEWRSDKRSRREFVARTHRILLVVGDDLNDFVSGTEISPEERVALARRYQQHWGVKWVLIPNPVYGRWERSLYGFDKGLPRADILRRKYEELEPLE